MKPTKVKEHPMQDRKTTWLFVGILAIIIFFATLCSACATSKSCQSMQGNMKPLTPYNRK